MKNILYLHAGAELYGADIVLLELLKNLDKSIFKPYVVLPCEGPLINKLQELGIDVKVIPYPILRRKYFKPSGILKYVKDYFKYTSEIKRFAEEKNIDIIHTNTAAVLEGIYLKRRLRIPQIWHIHEIIVKPKAVYKFLSFLIAKNADKVITVSNAVKKHLIDSGYFKDNVQIIYNGVDNEKFNPKNESNYLRKEFNIPEDAIIVGMIGRVNAWKGQADFLRAMDTVLKENENVYAMLVGGVFEGEEWRVEEVKKEINSIRDKDRIIFCDYRSDSKNIHCLYDIFVLPSINPDPLPTVVLEAMASGKPIVGYRHGGICEMVKNNENGLLCDVRNSDDLARKINKLVNEEKLRIEMGKNSSIRQKKMFSLNAYINNFTNIYQNM